ncbi:Mbeg1-like protein [Alloscardovia venturai]|uniref:Mbeg1-like protein n=1 Tax=Alloscardovia venturai TaxID=1769421 RepID=A0ABW2Y6V1_9BIFI
MRLGSIIDYARSQFATFDVIPFNDVDAAIFAQLSYAQLTEPFTTFASSNTALLESKQAKAQASTLVHYFQRVKNWLAHKPQNPVQLEDEERFTSLYQAFYHAEDFSLTFSSEASREQMVELITAMIGSPRYRDVQVGEFVYQFNEERYNNEQFAAMTFLLPDGTEYISLRGTEATFVGWREDFQLAFDDVIPSQISAVSYVNTIARRSHHPLIIGGHSKGGNTAVYAAVHCDDDVRSRIQHIYTFDGPGSMTDIMQSQEFKDISHRLTKLVPQESFIGMMFEYTEPYQVIHSNATGINQHFLFSWDVDLDSDDFVHDDALTVSADNLSSAYIAWTNTMDRQERREIIDAMFAIVEASGYDNFTDLANNISISAPAMWQKFRSLDEDERAKLVDPFTNLFAKIFHFNWATSMMNPATWSTPDLQSSSVVKSLASLTDRIIDAVTPTDTTHDADSNE